MQVYTKCPLHLQLADAGHGAGQEDEEDARGCSCRRFISLQRARRKVRGHQRRRARRVRCQARTCARRHSVRGLIKPSLMHLASPYRIELLQSFCRLQATICIACAEVCVLMLMHGTHPTVTMSAWLICHTIYVIMPRMGSAAQPAQDFYCMTISCVQMVYL